MARHKSLCPFHDDHHASLVYNTGRNTCRCFVCMKESMGTIDLVMRHLGSTFRRRANGLPTPTASSSRSGNRRHSRRLKANAPSMPRDTGRLFEHPWLNGAARRFLFDERRIHPEGGGLVPTHLLDRPTGRQLAHHALLRPSGQSYRGAEPESRLQQDG